MSSAMVHVLGGTTDWPKPRMSKARRVAAATIGSHSAKMPRLAAHVMNTTAPPCPPRNHGARKSVTS
jgi:hypothetical protein